MNSTLENIGKAAKIASQLLAKATNSQKNIALRSIAQSLADHQTQILAANQQDVMTAKQKNQSPEFIDRLTLKTLTIDAMRQSLLAIAELPDPIGTVLATWTRPNGLLISRVRTPLGVLAVIYESRPNVTIDAAGLCLKSGNAVILRGGSESFLSTQSLLPCIQQGLHAANLPATCVQMLPTPDRAAVSELLQMDQYIDVVVPRGSQALIERVSRETRIPIFKHLAGNCHTYVHASAEPNMAKSVLLNAKMRRTGICAATETLLIDRVLVSTLLPQLIEALQQANCEVRVDQELSEHFPELKIASEDDWDTEFLAPIIAIKVVTNVDEAIAHIGRHGTQHTEAIIAQDTAAAEKFLQEVDSAIVIHNASTQFADGGEFGMGAEMGISTGKLHARGPIGVEQLTTFKYHLRGNGQIRP